MEKPEDFMHQAVAAELDSQNILGPLKYMYVKYTKVGFNDEAKFGFLCNAVMLYPDIVQFALLRSLKTYADLKVVIKDLLEG